MDDKPAWNPGGFVAELISRCRSDTAFRAAMRRADNPRTAAFAWPHLVKWCDLGKEYERLPFALVAAAVARELPEHDGDKDIGQLFRSCCTGPDDTEREQRRFRRLIGCDNAVELCEVLRPVLSYLQSKVPGRICYAKVLADILYFGEKVKLRWADHFFGNGTELEQEDNGHVSD